MPPSTGLQHGPYPRALIDLYVPPGRTIGVYVLGYMAGDTFVVRYVGRSDHHDEGLRGRLHQHDDDDEKAECTHFKFDYFASAKEAFERECCVYHDFKRLLNDVHPPRPAGQKYRCPRSALCFAGDQV